MTEDQAKERWCPFTRVGEQASGAAENRPDGSYNCIGSACMAWRCQGKPVSVVKFGEGKVGEVQHGFCGLAGASQ